MEFTETKLKGAYLVRMRKIEDERGYFARAWCSEEFEKHGIRADMVQLNAGRTLRRGTVRGMHYQLPPHAEAKFIRCTRGAIYDVIIDLRENSPTHKQWVGVELSAESGLMMYVPEGFAHGMQALEDETETYYMTSAAYHPQAARGVRHDDPAFGIVWPVPVTVVSDADRGWPDYRVRV